MLCLTDTSLYIYICVKHFGMAKIKLLESTSILLNISTRANNSHEETVKYLTNKNYSILNLFNIKIVFIGV